MSSAGALLNIRVRDGCIYLLSLNVPQPSRQGQLLGRIMVGMMTLQTRTRPEQDGPDAPCQSSLPCAFSRSAVSHTAEAFEGAFYVRKTEDSELENGMNRPLGRSHNEPRLIMKVLIPILKQALAFPLNRFLIISPNFARGSVNLPCAICVH